LDLNLRKKIAKFCNVSINAVIESRDADTIYDVPMLMQEEELDKVVLEKLNLPTKTTPNLESWKSFLTTLKNPTSEINIGLVGKYVELKDSYKSISESFIHAGVANSCRVNVKWIHSEKLTKASIAAELGDLDGILVAPGFGSRGISGKIDAVRYARENKIPFFGICLGMQCAVIEFARNVLGMEDAHTTEIAEDSKYPVISMMEEQKTIANLGGTMRLGAYKCELKPNSKAALAYNSDVISERHRHRYEFNNEYLEQFEKNGMIATGKNPETGLVEVVEIPAHPWFVGAQFHPEYKSTVANPHPLFVAFINAAKENKQN
jgi:CTP synthase